VPRRTFREELKFGSCGLARYLHADQRARCSCNQLASSIARFYRHYNTVRPFADRELDKRQPRTRSADAVPRVRRIARAVGRADELCAPGIEESARQPIELELLMRADVEISVDASAITDRECRERSCARLDGKTDALPSVDQLRTRGDHAFARSQVRSSSIEWTVASDTSRASSLAGCAP
jgi:hypothetical protein